MSERQAAVYSVESGQGESLLANYAAMSSSDPHSQQDSLPEPVATAAASNSPRVIDVAVVPVSVAPMSNEAPGETTDSSAADSVLAREIGGRDGPEPTRFGDWEKGGRCIDF